MKKNKEAKIGYDGKPIQTVKPSSPEYDPPIGLQPKQQLGDGCYWIYPVKGAE